MWQCKLLCLSAAASDHRFDEAVDVGQQLLHEMMVEHGYKASEELVHRTMFALADAYHHTLRHVPLNAPGRRRLYSIGMRIAEQCARVRRMIGAPQSLQEGADWLVDTFPQMLRNPTRCGVNHAQSRTAAARIRAVPFKNQCDNVECENFEKDKAFSLCAKCRLQERTT